MLKNMSFGDMQREIYKFTITRMLPRSSQKDLRDDVIHLSEISDTFWVGEFDEVLQVMESRKPSWDIMLDVMGASIDSVSEQMANYYANSWNFPPGYTPIQMPYVNSESISFVSMQRLAKKIAPRTVAAIKIEEKKSLAEQRARLRAAAKLQKPKVASTVDAVLKQSKMGWSALHKYIQKHPKYVNDFAYDFTDAVNKALLKARSGVQVKKIVKDALTPEQYAEFAVFNVGELASEKFTWMYNPYTRKAIIKKLLTHYHNGVDF